MNASAFLNAEKTMVCFEVADDGVGISKEDQRLIFDKFIPGRGVGSAPRERQRARTYLGKRVCRTS